MSAVIMAVLLFSFTPQTSGLIGNAASKLYHRAELEHVKSIGNPVQFSSREEAEAAGFTPCPVCFYPHPPVIRAIQEELLLAAQIDAQVRLHYPKWENTGALETAGTALERVLGRWPIPLKGYHYHIGLLDTGYLNAIAVPAGRIYLTRGLFQACESEEELEAILALQVAHIEGRHALRSWEASQGFGTLGRILGGVAATSTGLDLSRVINYARRVVLTGYSRGHIERAEELMAATLLTDASRAGARQIFQKLADLYRELGRTRTPFARIPVSEELPERFMNLRIYPVDTIFTATIPRTTGLIARFALSRIVCNGSACQLFGWLEILRGRQATMNDPALFVIDSQAGNASQVELLLESATGTVVSWSGQFLERQLGGSTVIGKGTEPESIDALLQGISSLTLRFPFTTTPGGNPIGNRLVLTPESGDGATGQRR